MTLDETLARYPGAATFRFGDNAALCAELTDLVKQGRKTGTCEALSVFASGAEAMPVVGRRDIALDWQGRPALVIQTLSLDIRRFDEVTEDFALSEGEHDSLEGWRQDHRRYFERTCGWSPGMELVCERFHVVEVLE